MGWAEKRTVIYRNKTENGYFDFDGLDKGCSCLETPARAFFMLRREKEHGHNKDILGLQ